MFRADLHCHSTCSDGTLSPCEIVELAKKIGLGGLSFTDHDNIDAYLLALSAAKTLGISLGSGVEFSSKHKKANIHLLGYDYDPSSQDLIAFCALHQKRRETRNRAILENLARIGMPLSEEKLRMLAANGHKTIGRPHIAQLMVEAGYVSGIKEAFSRFLADDQCCYATGESFSVEETIHQIHKAGGKAFIAHPHLITHGRILKDLLELPFDGIECYYGISTSRQEAPWLKIAAEKKWLVSGGSDFHGSFKPQIPFGASWVDEKTFRSIFKNTGTSL